MTRTTHQREDSVSFITSILHLTSEVSCELHTSSEQSYRGKGQVHLHSQARGHTQRQNAMKGNKQKTSPLLPPCQSKISLKTTRSALKLSK